MRRPLAGIYSTPSIPVVDVIPHRDEYLLADGTIATGQELKQMQQQSVSKFEEELFEGFKQAVGQEVFDFLKSSERYKHVRIDYENVGPMGGKSVKVSGWAVTNDGNAVVPFILNLYCDSVVYERMKSELLEAQEFAKSQEDIKKFLTEDD